MATPRVLLLVLGLAGLRHLADPLVGDALAALAALLAAMSFARGDPPRRPWLLRAAAIGLVLAAHAVQRTGLVGEPRLDYLLLIVANLLGAAAIVGFLQIVRRSGLADAPSRGERLLLAFALGGALGLVGWLLPALDGTPLRVAAVVVSTLADAAVFVVSLVLLRLVVPLRGGAVAQPYFLLVVDGLCFLLIDLVLAIDDPALTRAVAPLGALGGAAGTAAGLCQAALLRRDGVARA